MLLGCAVGAFTAGRLADRFGRRLLLIAAAVFFIISAWGSGVAGSSFEFVIYRVMGGLTVEAASVMAPAYISEITPARYRGALTAVQQLSIIFGLFSAFVSNYFLADIAGASTAEFWMGYEAWRWMFWIELLPASVFLLALMFIPESPRYLVISGNFVRNGSYKGGFVSRASSSLTTMTSPTPVHIIKLDKTRQRLYVIAIANGLKMAMGAMAEASVPAHLRWLPKGMTLEYSAKAVNDIRCVAEVEPSAWQAGNLIVPVVAYDEQDTVLVKGTITLWITEKPTKMATTGV
jgi:MFS family permease